MEQHMWWHVQLGIYSNVMYLCLSALVLIARVRVMASLVPARQVTVHFVKKCIAAYPPS